MAKSKSTNKNVSFTGTMCGVREMQSEIEKVSTIDEGHSYYSLSNGILPALGAAHSTNKLKIHCYIISPFNPLYRFLSCYFQKFVYAISIL